MSKRHLSKQQLIRIKQAQDNRIKQVEQTDGDELTGLIIAHYGLTVDVEADYNHQIYKCQLRQNIAPLAAGDKVIWQQTDKFSGVVTAHLPRRTLFGRPDKRGQLKPLAANIDKVAVVAAYQPAPSAFLLDSYLVAIEALGLIAIIVFNKTDLIPANDSSIKQLSEIYSQLNYPVLFTSTLTESGLTDLANQIENVNSVFVGQTGVGKSSLINYFVPERKVKIGSLSKSNTRGKHTTTIPQLYKLPTNGYVLDSPGVHEFGLWRMTEQDIWRGFKEILALQGQCKYRDCKHAQEPECALQQASKQGLIHRDRLSHFQRLLADSQDY